MNQMQKRVAYWSMVAIAFIFVVILAYPSEELAFNPPPRPVRTVVISNSHFKSDRIVMEEARPFLELMVDASVPQPPPPPQAQAKPDDPVPPEEVEEEPEMEKPASKPERSKFKDVCARNGGKKVTYTKHHHEMWKCVYPK